MNKKEYNIDDEKMFFAGISQPPIYITPYWQPIIEGRHPMGHKVPFGFLITNLRFWIRGVIGIANAIIPIVSLGFIRSNLAYLWCFNKSPKLKAFRDWLYLQGV